MTEIDTSVAWTHMNDGGRYRVIGEAKGAGRLHGEAVVIYSDAYTGQLYARKRREWFNRMQELPVSPIAEDA